MIRSFLTVFLSVFIAEMGDKTQLATFLFSTDKEVSKLTVFVASALALVLTSAIGVLAGKLISDHVNVKIVNYVAGVIFILMGFLIILKNYTA